MVDLGCRVKNRGHSYIRIDNEGGPCRAQEAQDKDKAYTPHPFRPLPSQDNPPVRSGSPRPFKKPAAMPKKKNIKKGGGGGGGSAVAETPAPEVLIYGFPHDCRAQIRVRKRRRDALEASTLVLLS